MRVYIVVFVALILSGCAQSGSMQNINGKYYIMGDNNCSRYNILNDGLVQCFNSNGNISEQRRALTQSEIQYVMNRQAIEEQQLANMGQQLQQNSAVIAQNATNLRNTYTYNYNPPQAISPSSNQMQCIRVGIYTSCQY